MMVLDPAEGRHVGREVSRSGDVIALPSGKRVPDASNILPLSLHLPAPQAERSELISLYCRTVTHQASATTQ